MATPFRAGGLVLCALLASGSLSEAADLDAFYGQPEEVEPPQDFTFGTGWYLRGDATATDDRKADLLGTDTDKHARDWNYGVGGGVGYTFGSHLRADLTADYFGPQKSTDTVTDGTASLSLRSSLHRFDALANAYVDLGTWHGLTPYVGGGIGFAGLRLNGTYRVDDGFGSADLGRIHVQTRYDLAWAAMAGLSYSVSANLLIDVGYRYLDLGRYAIARSDLPAANGRGDLDAHQIRAGLRYMLY